MKRLDVASSAFLITMLLSLFMPVQSVSATSQSVKSTPSAPLSVISFNVESGNDTQPEKVAKDIEAIGAGVQIFGLSEVPDLAAAQIYAAAAGRAQGKNHPPYKVIISKTGDSDRTVILYDANRFEIVAEPKEYIHETIEACGSESKHFRASLAATFRDKRKPHREFIFIVNHLHRSRADFRLCQAALLNELASKSQLPMIAVGDFNFDWELGAADQNKMPVAPGSICNKSAFLGPQHDIGFDKMTAGSRWCWVMPVNQIKSQCSSHYDSILDFVFVAHQAKKWAIDSDILMQDPMFCLRDTIGWSDHRAIRGNFLIQ